MVGLGLQHTTLSLALIDVILTFIREDILLPLVVHLYDETNQLDLLQASSNDWPKKVSIVHSSQYCNHGSVEWL